MLSKRAEKVQAFAFKRILSLNKPELTSLPLTAILLFTKFLLGPFLVVAIFFANKTAFSPLTSLINAVISLHHYESDTVNMIVCSILSFLNVLITVLFLNFFQKKQSQVGNRLLLAILVLVQTAKYFIIVIVCAQIRDQIIDREFLYGIINTFNLIFVLFWNHLFEKFYFTLNYSTKNLIARFNLQIHEYIESFLSLSTVVMALIGHENLSNVLQIIFNALLLMAKAFFIYKGLLKWLYVNRNIQQIYAFFFMIETVILFGNLIIQLTDEHLLKSNFFVSIFITALFCFLGWKSFFDWNQEDVYFARGKDIKDSSKATMYLKALHQIVSKNQHNSQSNSLILASIKKQHQIECKNTHCYCRSHAQGVFIRQYSIEQLQALRNTFKNSPKILIQKLNLRFYMFQSYPDILNRLQQIENSFALSLTEQYSLLSLKTELKKFISEKNLSLNMIDVESPLRLEQVSTNLENIIKKDIEKKSKKWKYLARGMCRIEELEQDTNNQIKSLKDITQIIDKEMKNFKRSILFNILIMFYYKKISFLNVKNDQIQKNLSDLLKKIKQEELSSTKEFSKWIFHKRSCVIESIIDHQKMGTISRSSKNVHEMFGYSQKKLIGMNLSKLMPNFMVEQHNTIINEWVKTGTWRTIGRLKEIFCIHKDDMCFSALIYLKIIAHQNGLFFVGVVFKKNESDYLILNQKQQIEGVGRKFIHVMGQNCRRLPINILCSDFPTLDKSRAQDFVYYTKEFISLSGQNGMAEEFLEEKNRKFLTDEEEKRFISSYKHKLQRKQVGRWEVGFGVKIFRMRELPFYVVLLNYAKRIQNNETQGQSIANIAENKIQLVVGTGKANQNQDFDAQSEVEPSNITVNQQHEQFFDQKNSSMASFAERQSFTLTKLLRVFYEFLITPSDVRNKRINTLNVCTLLETLILTVIISVSFFVYMNSLNEIKLYLSANAEISQGMQLTTSMFNKVMSFQEYQMEPETMGRFLRITQNDLGELFTTMKNQLKSIDLAVSQLHSQELYQYLKSPINYTYAANLTRQIQVLQFLTYYFYLTTDIRDHFLKQIPNHAPSNILLDKQYELDRIRQNFPQLKQISAKVCEMFSRMTQTTQQHLIIAAWTVMILFFVVTLGFFIYTYMYFSFRYTQKHQCLEIYKTIPSTLIQKIKDYYSQFYISLFSATSTKSANIQQNMQQLNTNQLTIDDTHASTMLNNKIKFIGKHKFTGWVRSLLMLFAVNTVNVLITYEILNFASPLTGFIGNVNDIISTENLQIESYLEIKAKYLILHKPELNPNYIDNLLAMMRQNEVKFNQMVMFQSEILTLYDPEFYAEFYQILVDNVCLQIKETMDEAAFKDCMALSNGSVIEDGVITYMNYFQRKVRTVLQDLKLNSSLRLSTEGSDYFLNRGFKQIDISLSYSIRLFRKLIQRIIVGYKKGIEYISFINIIVLVLLISPQITSLVLWFHLVKQEKEKLSLLYGSVLMIPPSVIKHVKNLPRMAKKILEFEEC